MSIGYSDVGGRSWSNGAPFAGIPPEVAASIEALTVTEPTHPEPDATFHHRPDRRKRLSLWSLLRRQWKLTLLSTMFVTIEAVGYQVGPFLTKIGIDNGIAHTEPKLVDGKPVFSGGKEVFVAHPRLSVVVICGVIYIVSVLLTMWVERSRIRQSGKLSANVMNDLRVETFAHIQRLSLDYFTEEKAGVIMTRMTSDIEVLQQLLQDGIAQFVTQFLTMVIIAVVLFIFNWQLALITVVICIPPLIASSLWFRVASERSYTKVRDTIAAVISDIAESLSGVRVIASFNRQANNVIHHRNVLGRYRDANFWTARVSSAYATASDFIGLGGQLVILLIGGSMALRSYHHVGGVWVLNQSPELTIGELTAFILYLSLFFAPIQQLVQLYSQYQQGQAALVKLRQLFVTSPSVLEAEGAIELPPIEGDIVLENVEFGYDPARPVLRDVNLHISPGETISFVGATGAGKSTIAKLVTRFYDPTAGRILIDGIPIDSVTIDSLRHQLGVVPQEPFLFSGTIRDNVAFAKPNATDADVLGAIDAVGLSELMERLQYGIDTVVHERGQSLSSGERQLIALARAFLAGPRVLVLDEATSNLDLKSETMVEHALDRLLAGRTAILIAHRLTTAMRADRIVVVDDGRIVEVGPHQDLIDRAGLYAQMFATWSRQHEEEDVGKIVDEIDREDLPR
ncbi:MAG TPA: ABC transporter ATP-binding protein [Acidimicrobiales bacterium]|jgi:ATP-binding cassette subfamily B protein|nr:ABC transporter ATP-binding protein [Acidimicrobiales bacterium]